MNQIIDTCVTGVNNVGREFCVFAGGMFIQSAVLIAILFVADWLLRKRVKATFRYWIWMLVFIKLILPPSLSSPASIGYWCHNWIVMGHPAALAVVTVPAEETPPETEPVADSPSDSSAMVSSEEPSPSPADPSASSGQALRMRPSRHIDLAWQGAAFILWLVGVLVLSTLLLQRVCFVRGLIAQSIPAEERLLELLSRCCDQMGIRRSIGLRLSPAAFSPAVCGLLRPVILVPEAMLRRLSSEDLRAVLIHELAHVRRGDLWLNSLQTLLQIAYFYNPFVWLAGMVTRRVREQAVDEMVLVALGAEAKSYSRTLVDIAEMAFFKPTWTLRMTGVVESKKALEGRITHMLTRPVPNNAKLGLVGVLAVLITAALLLPMAKSTAGQHSQTPPGESTAGAKDMELGVVFWMALFDPDLDKEIRSISKVVETSSKPCQCLTCDANELAAVLRQAMRTRKDIELIRSPRWVKPAAGERRPMLYEDNTASSWMPWGGHSLDNECHYTLDTHGAAARLDLESQYSISIRKQDRHNEVQTRFVVVGRPGQSVEALATDRGQARFSGEIRPGRAIVFLGDLKRDGQSKVSYIMVWQAVFARSGVFAHGFGSDSFYSTQDWIERGPDEVLKRMADSLERAKRAHSQTEQNRGNDATIMVAQWTAAVEPSMARDIRSISQSIPTTSVSYDCLTCDGDALIAAIRRGQQNGSVINVSREMGWLPDEPVPVHGGPFSPGTSNSIARGLSWTLWGTPRLNASGAQAQLDLDFTANCRLSNKQGDPNLYGRIVFVGDIAPGKAVVFLGDLKLNGESKASHVFIWQAIQVPSRLVSYLKIERSSQNWIERGPSDALKQAQEAHDLARRPAQGHAETPAKWTHTFSDGYQVKLVAVFRPKDSMLRFWSPDGQRIPGVPDWAQRAMEGQALAAIIERPEYKIADPNAHEAAASDGRYYTICQWSQLTPGQSAVLAFPHPSGQWQTVGQLRQEQPLEIGGLSYAIQSIEEDDLFSDLADLAFDERTPPWVRQIRQSRQDRARGVRVTMLCKADPNSGIRLIAVDKDGKQYPMEAEGELRVWGPSNAGSRGEFGMAPMAGGISNGPNGSRETTYRGWTGGLALEDVDHFVLQKRPLALARFTGFAREPNDASGSASALKP